MNADYGCRVLELRDTLDGGLINMLATSPPEKRTPPTPETLVAEVSVLVHRGKTIPVELRQRKALISLVNNHKLRGGVRAREENF